MSDAVARRGAVEEFGYDAQGAPWKAGAPGVRGASMVQWCAPWIRQQAGSDDCGVAAEANSGRSSGEANAMSSVMASVRRIRRV